VEVWSGEMEWMDRRADVFGVECWFSRSGLAILQCRG
jgi:hypothetical protein